jgi:Methionine synthase I (cobalamin-dependent), methyltransferase domain
MVLDGATGTALMSAGMPNGACPEEWIPKNPDVLQTIQRGYFRAGSDAVLAPTFGGNRPALERHGLCDCSERNKTLASLTHTARSEFGAGLVGGDIAPTGLFLKPYGDATFDYVASVYAEQAKALDPYVDFFISETNLSLAETRAAVTGIKSVSDKPIFVTFTLDKNGRTLSGDDMLCALLTLAELGIAAFGANCSVGPADILRALEPLVPYAAALGIPLIAKPNAGLPHDTENGRIFDLDADGFGSFAPMLLDAGIYILGGCCGTDDKYIAKLKKSVDNFTAPESLPSADSAHLICNTKKIIELDTANMPKPLSADEELFDCEEDFALVRVENETGVEFLRENSAMLPCPIALVGDRALCESAKREYNGKLLII